MPMCKYTVNCIYGDERIFDGLMDTLQHEITIPLELDGKRLDQALAEVLPEYSRSRLKGWILAGDVSVDGDSAAPRTRVKSGQRVRVTVVLEIQQSAQPEAMDLAVVYEDDDLLVIDKPAGLVVHPGAGNPAGTLMNGLLHHAPDLGVLPRSGILHRLDKDTSGLLLVAKSIAAHTRLVKDLQERQITREYRGLCAGRLTAGGTIDAPIGRHPTQRTRMAVTERGRPAVTHYRVLTRFAAHTLIALRLESGRTHQIRVHMANIRHALIGDRTYGGRLKLPAGASGEVVSSLRSFSRQALHASRLAFRHPLTDQLLDFQSPLPRDFVDLLQALDSDEHSSAQHNDPARWDRMRWPEPKSS
jgi:23S rRNA pseudouridine1911/1915/1917 synthase